MTSELSERINILGADLAQLSTDVAGDETARKQLLGVLKGATSKLEYPHETLWQMLLLPSVNAMLITLLNLGVISKLVQSDGPMTAYDLASATGGEAGLIVRLMRPVTALGLIKEVGERIYQGTAICKAIVHPDISGAFQFIFSVDWHTLCFLPSYFKSVSYKNVNGYPGPFQYARKTDEVVWEWLEKHPDLLANFNSLLAGSTRRSAKWFDRMNVDEVLLDGIIEDPAATLIVDVGGGVGQDLQAFHVKYPEAPGKLVLQDLAKTVESIGDLSGDIELQVHDFFTPQPIKGARIYHLRAIMHDWGDIDCVKILTHIARVMTPGYSKIIITDHILPQKGVSLFAAFSDISMMANLNGMERTEEQFRGLMKEAGLKIMSIVSESSGEGEAHIVAELE